MRTPTLLGLAVAAVSFLLVFIDPAAAAKKAVKQPTFEEAWARCKVHVDKLPWDAHS